MPKEQLLMITPPAEIFFKGPYTKIVTEQLVLSNPTDQHIAFKVKTTAPKKYCVRPNNGFIAPKKQVTVSVMLQPQNKDDILSEKHKHKFMIQSVISPTESGVVEEIFKAAGPGQVMDSKFRCVFDESLNEPSGSSSKMEFALANQSSLPLNDVVTKSQEEIKETVKEPKTLSPIGNEPSTKSTTNTGAEDAGKLKVLIDENKFLRHQVKELEVMRSKNSGHITGSIPVVAQPSTGTSWFLIFIISLIAMFAGVIIGKWFQ